MATYTATPLGGNWNVAATWGGAGVPTTGDTAILNALSGPVTVTTNSNCLIANFTGYTNSFTINAGFFLTVGSTITLGATMPPILGTGRFVSLGSAAAITINFNGITIPNLQIGFTSGAGTQTVTINGTTPTVQNLIATSSVVVSAAALAGTALNISNSLNITAGNLGGVAFNFSGATCSVTTSGTITGGFTVLDGCNLSLSSNLSIGNGIYTFQPLSLLTHNSRTLVLFPSISCTLNTSAVVWFNISDTAARTILTSDLNISGSLTIANLGSFFQSSGGARNVNLDGSLSVTAIGPGPIAGNGTIFNFNGSGVWDGIVGSGFSFTTFNINTSGYTIGSATRNGLFLYSCTINLVGSNSCSVFTNHTVSIGPTGAPNTTVFNTNNTGIGGSQIIWENLNFGTNTVISLATDTTFAKNLTAGASGTATINNSKLFVGGNLTTSGEVIQGSSIIELYGSSNSTWSAGSYTSNIIVNKTSGATVTTGVGTISWGAPGRTFTMNSAVNFLTNFTTFSLGQTPVTINNLSTPTNQFFNLTVLSGITLNIEGSTMLVARTLLCSGSATFAGTHGFTCQNFTCTTAAAVITLQNIVASSLAEYRINGVLTLIGTAANRIVLQSAGSASFNGTITPVDQLNYLSGTIPQVGMTISQATGVSSTGLIGLLPNRPVITGGTSPTFTISPSATAIIGSSFSIRAGFKAKFILTNGTGTQNVVYAQTQDIDSSDGQTILSFGSNGDDVNNSTIALFRTLNWGPLVAPSGSVYYTFVN